MKKIPPIRALVPMKYHSERVPGKNLRPFCGEPLFFWALSALKASSYIQELVIDTDSRKIASAVEERFEASIMFRPKRLCGDMVMINPLIEYQLSKTQGEYFLQTHVTNRLLRPETINSAIETFFSSRQHDSLFSVSNVQQRLYWEDGRAINHDPKRLVRTQDLSTVWAENCSIYIFSRKSFGETGHRIGKRPLFFPMSALESVDIDWEEDFKMAEALMQDRLAADQRSVGGTAHS